MPQVNPLMPQPAAPAPGGSSAMAALVAHHTSAKAKFDKLSEVKDLSDKTLDELGHLSSLGDTVTTEDVVDAAGKLVADGLNPLEVAGLLADMPSGGEALQAWVASHAQAAAANAKALGVHHEIARHDMGMAALRELTGHAVIPSMDSPAAGGDLPAPPPAPSGNALMPGGGPGGTPNA